MAKARDIPGLSVGLPFAKAAGRTVAVRTEELFAASEGVLDITAIERVHDMRVASRRLRAALEIYAPCFPRRRHRDALRDVKALADALGARRDPDVQLAAVAGMREAMTGAEAAGLDLFERTLKAEQSAGNQTLATALQQAERSDLHARLVALTARAA